MRVVVLLVLLAQTAQASPRDDIASPSQATRDEAAAKLRASFKPTPKSKLAPLVAKIKRPGMTKDKTLALLARYKPTTEGAGASGGGETILYRIDDSWLLEAAFSTRGDGKVIAARLVPSVRDVWVEPPAGFTGSWKTYRANGTPSHSFDYKDGERVSGE